MVSWILLSTSSCFLFIGPVTLWRNIVLRLLARAVGTRKVGCRPVGDVRGDSHMVLEGGLGPEAVTVHERKDAGQVGEELVRELEEGREV